jgi:hypothetical protein
MSIATSMLCQPMSSCLGNLYDVRRSRMHRNDYRYSKNRTILYKLERTETERDRERSLTDRSIWSIIARLGPLPMRHASATSLGMLTGS